MKPTSQPELLTIDEARSLLGSAAIVLVDALAERPHRIAALLAGAGTLRGLSAPERAAVKTWREALRRVRSTVHGWIIDDEIDGAQSYADLTVRPMSHRQAA